MNLKDLKNYSVVSGPGTGVVPQKPPDTRDFLQKTGDVVNSIFPGKQVGESIGALAGYALTPKENRAQYDLKGPSTVQVLGDVASGAANIAGFKGVGTGGGLLKNALQSAGLGAVMSGGKSTAEGNDLATIAKDTAIGAGTGAAVSGALGGTEALLKGFRALPERFIRSATGQTRNEILAGEDISKYVLDNKKIGTVDQLIRGSQKAIDQADNIIAKNLDSITDVQVPVKDVIRDIAESANASGAVTDEIGIRNVLSRLAPQVERTLAKESLTLSEANRLRSQIDKTIGDKGFLTNQLTYDKGILMDFANAIREQVKSRAPEGTRAAFNTLSKELTLRDTLLRKAAGGGGNLQFGLGDMITGSVGGVFGGLPGALALGATRRAVESTIAKTGAAVVIDRLDEALTPVLSNLEPALQTEILNAITSAFTGLENEK